MRAPTPTLAAVLLLGTASFAMAQRDDRGGPAPPMAERAGPAMELPSDGARGGDAPDGLIRKSEGPNPEVRDGAPRAESREAVREDPSGPKDTTAAEKGQGNAEGRAERKAGKGDGNASEAGKRAQRPDRSDSKAEANKTKEAKKEKAADRGGAANNGTGADEASRKPKDRAARQDRGQDDAAEKGAKRADRDGPKADAAKTADVSGERAERVRSAFRGKRDVKRRRDVDVDIVIGARLPSAWDYAPVPVAVIEVVPEYRGYYYTYVEDEYIITDPETYEVVAVLPASGGGATYASRGGGAETCSASLALSEDDRALIVKSIQITDEADVSDVSVGWSVPSDLELRPFPQPVVERTGKLSSCRYFIVDDRIAIVDPQEDTVVLLIEQD